MEAALDSLALRIPQPTSDDIRSFNRCLDYALCPVAEEQINLTPVWCAWSSLSHGRWLGCQTSRERILQPYAKHKQIGKPQDITHRLVEYFGDTCGTPPEISRRICLLARYQLPYRLIATRYVVTHQDKQEIDYLFGLIKFKPTIKRIPLAVVMLYVDLHSYWANLVAAEGQKQIRDDEDDAKEKEKEHQEVLLTRRRAVSMRTVTRTRSSGDLERTTTAHRGRVHPQLRRRATEGPADITHLLHGDKPRTRSGSNSSRFYIYTDKHSKHR